jgi:hypothetical protein
VTRFSELSTWKLSIKLEKWTIVVKKYTIRAKK